MKRSGYVLFFAIESLTGGTVFSTPLESHLHTQPWSPLAQTLVENRLAALGTTAALFAPRFDAAVAVHARSLILLMALYILESDAASLTNPRASGTARSDRGDWGISPSLKLPSIPAYAQ